MSIEREERGSDSPFVERITQVRYPRTAQVERAHRAVNLLRNGRAVVDVAFALGSPIKLISHVR